VAPRLSQHFLHDRSIAQRIAEAIPAQAGSRVVEIGPGRGALTEPLLERGFRVFAVELDRLMAEELRWRWGDQEGFELVEGDALDLRLPDTGPDDPVWVVGNLPYAITSPLLFHFLDQIGRAHIAGMVFMIQKEVAERLAADPGTKAYGALTVGVRLVADVERLFDVGPGAFRPPPAVVSSVIRLTPHDRFGLDEARRERLRALVQALFGHRRKQVQKSLRTLPGWSLDHEATVRVAQRSGLDLSRRPETLSPQEFLALETALGAETSPSPAPALFHRDTEAAP
jgi:16S rRNA (adenine1518-N6/adenine1519-N6)-dimethyltransferase